MELITIDATNMNDYIDKQIESAINEMLDEIEQNQMPVFCNLGQACKVVGVGRNKLRDVLYENKKELNGFVHYGNRHRPWKITTKKFKEWAEENPQKFK